jgi:hypothetical protein
MLPLKWTTVNGSLKENIVMFSKSHEDITTLFGENAQFWFLNFVVGIVTNRLQSFKFLFFLDTK